MARWPVSPRWDAQIRRGARVLTRVDVHDAYGQLLHPNLPIHDGTITIDGRQAQRRSCTISLADPDRTLTPAAADDLLSLLSGNEIRPWWGVRYPDGSEEWAPLGSYRIRANPATTTALTVTGDDPSRAIAANGWLYPHPIPANTALEDALAGILRDRAPGLDLDLDLGQTGILVPATTLGLEGSADPWQDATELAADHGYVLWIDQARTARLEPAVDVLTATPVLELTEDEQGLILDGAGKDWDDSDAFNGGLVVGESSDSTPVQVEVWDDDPASPTYAFGPYGRRPWPTITTPQATTVEAVTRVGLAEIAKRRGAAQVLTLPVIPDGSWDADMPIRVWASGLRVSAQVAVVEAITLPLTVAGGPMQVRARTAQVRA